MNQALHTHSENVAYEYGLEDKPRIDPSVGEALYHGVLQGEDYSEVVLASFIKEHPLLHNRDYGEIVEQVGIGNIPAVEVVPLDHEPAEGFNPDKDVIVRIAHEELNPYREGYIPGPVYFGLTGREMYSVVGAVLDHFIDWMALDYASAWFDGDEDHIEAIKYTA